MGALIGLDWGTTSFRAYRVAADGAVLGRREAPAGILRVEEGRFAQALGEAVGDWLAADPQAPVIASGMIGSRQGWREVPYVPCPAGAAELAAGTAVVAGPGGRPVRLVPGVLTRAAGTGVPDVMRGEETQVLGALGEGSGLVVLPGTHSKWATVEAGRITGFTTWMTGELFDVLRRHSILGRLMEGEEHDPRTFDLAVRRGAAQGSELPHALFAARTLGLTGELPPASLPSYLSGLLIGAELAAAGRERPGAAVTVVANSRLTDLYLRAMRACGMTAGPGPDDAVVAGLSQLARSAGLLGAP